uniref:Uncharacterized protein n=1 Tax=Oryza nivara TaxID=4536 RepID=A0A0E0FFJ9_ORYNI
MERSSVEKENGVATPPKKPRTAVVKKAAPEDQTAATTMPDLSNVRLDPETLQCNICFLPFQPPIYQASICTRSLSSH